MILPVPQVTIDLYGRFVYCGHYICFVYCYEEHFIATRKNTFCWINGIRGSFTTNNLLYKWLGRWVHRDNAEDGKITPVAHLSTSLNTGRGIGNGTHWVDFVFTPDELWLGWNTNTNYAVIHNSYLYVEVMGMWIVFKYLLMGGGMAYDGLTFLHTGCPVPAHWMLAIFI